MEAKLSLLFLCTGNSCRSQMAEAWTNHLKGSLIRAVSAGTDPRGVDPRAVKVMAEVGVDISAQRSKGVEALADEEFDYVVTLCENPKESCPFYPAKTALLHVGFDDPPMLAESAANEDEALEHYRRVRDEIKAFVEGLPQSLGYLE